jgi:flagellar biosynthesis protein FlhF
MFARPEVQARSTASPAPQAGRRGAEEAGAPIRGGRVPDAAPGTYDWKGSLRRVDEEGRPVPAAAREAKRNGAADGAVQEDLLEMLRNELREMKDKVDMPTREIQVLKKEIKAMIDTVAGLKADGAAHGPAARPGARHATQLNQAVLAPQPPSAPGVQDFASPGALPPGLRGLHGYLLEMDVDADLAAELAYAAADPRVAAAPLRPEDLRRVPAGAPDSGALADLAGAMAARVRTTGGVRLRPGKPAVVALVGPTGAGKTTTLCKLAALAKMHQGKRVGILSADSFRMGANEQLELFGRTAGIPVRPLFSAADAAPALREFALCDLVLVDTAGRSHAHPEAWVELQALLRALSADEIHLVLSCTTRMREMIHQAGMYGGLCRLAPACGVVFTKLDECLSLGCMYNLARRLEAPVSYLCDGQVIPDHISLATPQSLAAKVLMPGRPAGEEAHAAARAQAVAG